LSFDVIPKAKSSSKPGSVYAIAGEDDYIYYGQISADKTIGFYNFRTNSIGTLEEVVSQPIMSRFLVNFPSIGRAMRKGLWLKMGNAKFPEQLNNTMDMAQWPVGELTISIWRDGKVIKNTSVFDPTIQDVEVMQAYDADYHVIERLKADYETPDNCFEVGGSIKRERRLKEMLAQKHQDKPWHHLPDNWVYSD
jgi:hypothetical protein